MLMLEKAIPSGRYLGFYTHRQEYAEGTLSHDKKKLCPHRYRIVIADKSQYTFRTLASSQLHQHTRSGQGIVLEHRYAQPQRRKDMTHLHHLCKATTNQTKIFQSPIGEGSQYRR